MNRAHVARRFPKRELRHGLLGFGHARAAIRIGGRKRSEVVRADDVLGRTHHALLRSWDRDRDRHNAPETAGRCRRDKCDSDRSWPWRSAARESRREPLRPIVTRIDGGRTSFSAMTRLRSGIGLSQLNRRDLCQRVNAGIGASRTLRQNIFAGEPLQAFGQRALHGCAARAAPASRETRRRHRPA